MVVRQDLLEVNILYAGPNIDCLAVGDYTVFQAAAYELPLGLRFSCRTGATILATFYACAVAAGFLAAIFDLGWLARLMVATKQRLLALRKGDMSCVPSSMTKVGAWFS